MPADLEAILGEAEYKNYRNVRAVSVLSVLVGVIMVIAGVSIATAGGTPERRLDTHPVVAVLAAIAGLAGAVSGVAILVGNKRLAPLVTATAWVFLIGFPIGTILGVALLTGLPQYLKSLDRLRRADAGDEEWDEDWDAEPR